MKRLCIFFLMMWIFYSATAQDVFVNEIRANDASTDDAEFIELIGPAGTDISGWQLVHVNGSGGEAIFEFIFPPGSVFPDDGFKMLNDQSAGFLVIKRSGHLVDNFDFEWGTVSLQNGPDGLLLSDSTGQRIQAITWNGLADLAGGDPEWRNVGNDQNTDFSLSAPDSLAEIYKKPWDYVAGTPGMINANQTGEDSSLPVQLSTFRAIGMDGRVKLYWVTESEVNNMGFILERSFTGEGDFQEIGSYESLHDLEGAINSSEKREYIFFDTSVFNGQTYWYRLTDVSVDGIRTIHAPVSATPATASKISDIDPARQIPGEFKLLQNYPNPFNPVTKIPFVISRSRSRETHVRLELFDILGKKVRTIFSGYLLPGQYEMMWDGLNQHGNQAANGIYYYVLQAGDFRFHRKMHLLR